MRGASSWTGPRSVPRCRVARAGSSARCAAVGERRPGSLGRRRRCRARDVRVRWHRPGTAAVSIVHFRPGGRHRSINGYAQLQRGSSVGDPDPPGRPRSAVGAAARDTTMTSHAANRPRSAHVDYETFTRTAAQRAGMPEDTVERVERATLRTLADRITGGEAQDLASQLPAPLEDALEPPRDEAEAFGVEELLRRVAERGVAAPDEARTGAVAVLTTVREAVSPGEFDGVMPELPREYRELVGPMSGETPQRPSRGAGGALPRVLRPVGRATVRRRPTWCRPWCRPRRGARRARRRCRSSAGRAWQPARTARPC